MAARRPAQDVHRPVRARWRALGPHMLRPHAPAHPVQTERAFQRQLSVQRGCVDLPGDAAGAGVLWRPGQRGSGSMPARSEALAPLLGC